MPSPLIQKPETATPVALNPVVSFLRFVILGGGLGVLSGLAVPQLAMALPWAVSNALVTAASTLLCTELHARFTFGTGRRAGWREHWQSAGSATAAYLATTGAVYVLHLAKPASGVLSEQTVYLSASALAGLGRFALLRLHVFATRREQRARTAPVVLFGPRCADGDPDAVEETTLNTSRWCASTPCVSAHGGGVTPAWDRGGLDERRVVDARLSA